MMKLSKMLAAGSLVCCAQAALSGPYDGIYRLTANSDCALIGVDGGAVEIRDGIFYGVESSCRMENPVQVIDMDAKLYNLECNGEGSIWSERVMLMEKASEDGIIMVWNGYAFVYDRCPDPDAQKPDPVTYGTAEAAPSDAAGEAEEQPEAAESAAQLDPESADLPAGAEPHAGAAPADASVTND